AALIIGTDGEGRAIADGDDAKAGRQAHDPVAMAHPDLLSIARLPQTIEEDAIARHLEEGAAELAIGRTLNLAADLRAECLLARADAKQGDAEFEHDLRGAGRLALGHRSRATR